MLLRGNTAPRQLEVWLWAGKGCEAGPGAACSELAALLNFWLTPGLGFWDLHNGATVPYHYGNWDIF